MTTKNRTMQETQNTGEKRNTEEIGTKLEVIGGKNRCEHDRGYINTAGRIMGEDNNLNTMYTHNNNLQLFLSSTQRVVFSARTWYTFSGLIR